jgi:hypothetical protein
LNISPYQGALFKRKKKKKNKRTKPLTSEETSLHLYL